MNIKSLNLVIQVFFMNLFLNTIMFATFEGNEKFINYRICLA